MSRKKLSPLIEAMNAFNQLDERGKQDFADYVRSQQRTQRPKSSSTPARAAGKQSRKPANAPSSETGEGIASSASGD